MWNKADRSASKGLRRNGIKGTSPSIKIEWLYGRDFIKPDIVPIRPYMSCVEAEKGIDWSYVSIIGFFVLTAIGSLYAGRVITPLYANAAIATFFASFFVVHLDKR